VHGQHLGATNSTSHANIARVDRERGDVEGGHGGSAAVDAPVKHDNGYDGDIPPVTQSHRGPVEGLETERQKVLLVARRNNDPYACDGTAGRSGCHGASPSR
jgi:hypothetical protein